MILKLPNSLGYRQWLFLTDYGTWHSSVNGGSGTNGFIWVAPPPPHPRSLSSPSPVLLLILQNCITVWKKV